MLRVRSPDEVRQSLAERLRLRQPEIERAVMSRVQSVAGSAGSADREYAHGLRTAVSSAIDYGLTVIERREGTAPAVPSVLLAQARLAARRHVPLDTVLRRYLAGYTLLDDFLIEEAQGSDLLDGAALKRMLRAKGALLDRVLTAISEEYAREREESTDSAEERKAGLVRRLLAGDRVDASDLGYDFSCHHLAVIAVGPDAPRALAELARRQDRRLLLVGGSDATLWAWLASRRPFEPGGIAVTAWPRELICAFGEPGDGLQGWRRSHRQARAALPIALRGDRGTVRYSEVALLASILRDELVVSSLRTLYLIPLEAERDGGAAARETLRAYFGAERNITSAAALLGVTRQTVSNRLRSVENRIGRSLQSCATDLELALQLEQLDLTT